MAKPNNPNGIVAERVIAKTVPKICLARYKEYFSVKKNRWNGAKNEQREKSWVATRRGRGESYFFTQPRLHHVFPALFSRKHEGWATIISPHLSSVLLFFALHHPRGCAFLISKPDTLDIRGGGGGEGRSKRRQNRNASGWTLQVGRRATNTRFVTTNDEEMTKKKKRKRRRRRRNRRRDA